MLRCRLRGLSGRFGEEGLAVVGLVALDEYVGGQLAYLRNRTSGRSAHRPPRADGEATGIMAPMWLLASDMALDQKAVPTMRTCRGS